MNIEDTNSTETVDQETPVVEEQSLDDFSTEFLGGNETVPEENEQETTDDETDDEAPKATEDEDVEETVEEEDEAPEEEEESSDDGDNKPKPNRFQKRINELVAEREATKRENEALEKRLEALEKAAKDTSSEDSQQDETTTEVRTGPTPDDKNEDGTPKYPLGQYDPDYIGDLAEFKAEEAQRKIEAKAEKRRQEKEAERNQQEIQANWDAKLEPARLKYNDFDEKGEELGQAIAQYDPRYAEYLAAQIMSMDNGTDVLYYLGANPDEAVEIMNMGPAKATQELGYLNGKFRSASSEKAKAKPKTSKAPRPPEFNKGSSQSMPNVSPDTDDLSQFESLMFKKK